MGEAIGKNLSSAGDIQSAHPSISPACLSTPNSRIYTVMSIILKEALYQSSGRVLDPELFSLKCFWTSHKAEMQMAKFTSPITQR